MIKVLLFVTAGHATVVRDAPLSGKAGNTNSVKVKTPFTLHLLQEPARTWVTRKLNRTAAGLCARGLSIRVRLAASFTWDFN